MAAQQQVGVVTLATATLQQQLGQGLGAALDALMKHLCREACQRCQAALDSCHTLTKCVMLTFHMWSEALLAQTEKAVVKGTLPYLDIS